jgi:hypothetical protein
MRRSFAVIAVVGCGHTISPGGVSIDQIPTAYKRALCEFYARCGELPDIATCLDANLGVDIHVDPGMMAAIAQGRAFYDGVAVATCFDAIGARACDTSSQSARDADTFFVQCAPFVQGTVEAGGACALDAECVSLKCNTLTCDGQCCAGTCVGGAPPAFRVAIGGSCADGSTCADGAYCDTRDERCKAVLPAGAPCTDDFQCDYELACFGATPTCKPLPQRGALCPDGRCRDTGTRCSAGTCVAVGLSGATCTSNADCSQYYVCDATNHCAEGPHVGESCANASCFDAGTFCSSTKTCEPLASDGSPCASGLECASGACDATMHACATPPTCT